MATENENGHGGARKGGGRPKGSPNKLTAAGMKRLEKMEEEGYELPLNYMLRVMNDPRNHKDRRDRMAIGAAPYCHNRLAAVVVKNDENKPFVMVTGQMSVQEAAAAYAAMVKE